MNKFEKRIGSDKYRWLEAQNKTFSQKYLKHITKIFNKRARLIESRQA